MGQPIGGRQSPGLKASSQYPGVPQTAAVTTPRWEMIKDFSGVQEHQNEAAALYLRATTDPEAQLTLNAQINFLAAITLVDSGATGIFMHPDFAQECRAEIKPKVAPREVRVIDGRMINSGLITHEAKVELRVGDHKELLVADITNTGRYPCILGMPWLVRHDPTIWWSRKEVRFESAYCQGVCLSQTSKIRGTEADCNERSCEGPRLLKIKELADYSKDVDRSVGQREEFQPTTRGTSQEKPKQVVLTAPKHAMVSAAAFRYSKRGPKCTRWRSQN